MTTNNTVINSIMRAYLMVVIVLGMSVNAWGATITLMGWNKATSSYVVYTTIQTGEQPGYLPSSSYTYTILAWAPGTQTTDTSYPTNGGNNNGSTYWNSYGFPTQNYNGDATTLYAVYFYNGYYTTAPDVQFSELVACTDPITTAPLSSKTVSYGAAAFNLSAARNGSGTVTWSSSNTSVASLSSTSATGATVTPGRAGTATITYSVAEKGDYCAGSATCEVTVTAKAPTVSHNATSKVLEVSAKTARTATFVGGVVTSDGGADIAKYGFVVGTTSGVTVSTTGAKKAEWNTSIAVGTKYGSKGVTGLSPNTTYYVRAYAKNASSNTYGYSTAVSFTTLNEYTISYDNNDGSGSISPQKKEEDATAVLNGGASFSKTGYDLSGWNTADDGTGDPYNLGDDYTANADATMYAVWTPAEYTITLNDQSATTAASPTNLTATYNASTGLTGTVVTTLPTKTGYTFGGYYTSTGGEGVQIIDADGSVIADANDDVAEIYTSEDKEWLYANDITLYAKWTAKTISLVLDNNGVTGSNGSATITFDNDAVNSSPAHATNSDATYFLAGYFSENTCAAANKVLDAGGNVVNSTVSGYTTSGKWTRATTPTTLYAKWTKTLYTVSFDMQGHGSSIDAQEVESGAKAIAPDEPVAEDWHFLGWYKEDTYTNKWDFDVNTVSDNTTLYAKWEEVTYNTTTYKAWCDPDIEITGDIHLTSTNGIAVYSTSTTSNLLGINSDDLAGVTKLDIKYLDADNGDAEVANASSLFRVCSSSDYSVADGSQIDVSAANTCDLSYSIRYTPNDYDVVNHYKLQITMKRGTRAVKTVTKDLYGRSLPEEFVIATKGNDGIWYALPNTIVDNSNAVTPIRITVNHATTPTAATYAPNTTVYKGDGRYAANSNRYAIRFTDGVLKDAKYNHLQISSNTDTHYPWLSYSGSSTNQDWWLKSTDCSAYELNVPTSGATSAYKLGIYSGNMGYFSSVTSGSIFLLPITNKLVENDAIVTEWGQTSVILDVDAQGIAGAQARIGNGEAERASSFGQTLTSVKSAASKYNYTVRFSTTDFSAHKGELLYIDWLDGEDNVVSTSQLTIPWIIASNGTMSEIESRKTYWQNEEVHVLPGVTLTADAGTFSDVTIKQLEIYPGATVKVTTGTLNVTDLVVRYGWTRANGKNYDVAQLQIKRGEGGANLTTTRAYADWYIDYDQYYPIAVPWTVTTANMSYKNSNSAASAGVKLRYYDGASRASNIQAGVAEGANWKEYSPLPATLEPSKGYAMTARRPTGKAFSIIRMPLTIPSASWTALGEQGEVSGTHKDQVSVTGWGIGTTTPWYAVGWNFIGNPYMSTFNGNDDGIRGNLQDQNGGSIRYATIPDIEFKNYDQVNITEANLKPASGFFVQASNEEAQNITFSSSQIIAPSVALRYTATAEVLTEQDAYIRLSSETAHDQMGLIIADEFTAEYETNADLVKILGEANTLKTYMYYNNMDMAYLAINQELALEWIPVVVKIPETGQYTFSLTNSSEVEQLAGVYLIDYNTNSTITNLIDDNYIFTANAGTYTNRFAINAIVGERQTPTAIDALDIGSDPDRPIKFIFHDKVFILYHGIIYDSTGKRVKEVRL